jgi:hypothetical protein
MQPNQSIWRSFHFNLKAPPRKAIAAPCLNTVTSHKIIKNNTAFQEIKETVTAAGKTISAQWLVTGRTTEKQWFRFPAGLNTNFVFWKPSRPAFERTQSPTRWADSYFIPTHSGRRVKLTTHLHTMPKLWMHGATPPFPACLYDVQLKEVHKQLRFLSNVLQRCCMKNW